MATIIRAVHAALPGGAVNFTDDEVLSMNVRPVQEAIQQRSQTNQLTVLYAGVDQFAFDLSFNIWVRSTLDRLNEIRALQEAFLFFPFLLESPATTYDVVWGDQPYHEQWIRGRREAAWDFNVTWEEKSSLTC